MEPVWEPRGSTRYSRAHFLLAGRASLCSTDPHLLGFLRDGYDAREIDERMGFFNAIYFCFGRVVRCFDLDTLANFLIPPGDAWSSFVFISLFYFCFIFN